MIDYRTAWQMTIFSTRSPSPFWSGSTTPPTTTTTPSACPSAPSTPTRTTTTGTASTTSASSGCGTPSCSVTTSGQMCSLTQPWKREKRNLYLRAQNGRKTIKRLRENDTAYLYLRPICLRRPRPPSPSSPPHRGRKQWRPRQGPQRQNLAGMSGYISGWGIQVQVF